jgi:hypothetical protein
VAVVLSAMAGWGVAAIGRITCWYKIYTNFPITFIVNFKLPQAHNPLTVDIPALSGTFSPAKLTSFYAVI